IESLLEQFSDKIERINLSITLEEALNMQFRLSPPPQTDKYKNAPAYIRSSDADLYEGGYISESAVNVRTQPKLSSNDYVYKTLYYGEAFLVLDNNVTGDIYEGSTRWYKILYDGRELYVHSTLATINSKVAIPKSTI